MATLALSESPTTTAPLQYLWLKELVTITETSLSWLADECPSLLLLDLTGSLRAAHGFPRYHCKNWRLGIVRRMSRLLVAFRNGVASDSHVQRPLAYDRGVGRKAKTALQVACSWCGTARSCEKSWRCVRCSDSGRSVGGGHDDDAPACVAWSPGAHALSCTTRVLASTWTRTRSHSDVASDETETPGPCSRNAVVEELFAGDSTATTSTAAPTISR